MEIKIKPCCKCGGQAVLIPVERQEDDEGKYTFDMFYVKCVNCGNSTDCYYTEEDAINEWNRTKMELNREQIIKALEYCSSGGQCYKCSENDKNPFLSKEGCMAVQMRNALALIKELTEKNERFRDENTLLLNFMLPDYEIPGMMRTQINLPKGFASANSPANKYCISGRALRESLKKVKSDIVKEFVERLNKHFCHDPAFLGVEQRLIMGVVDQIAKEMVGDGYDT